MHNFGCTVDIRSPHPNRRTLSYFTIIRCLYLDTFNASITLDYAKEAFRDR